MAYQSNNIQSPAAEYLYKLQMIVSNTDFKNKEEANKYETTEIKLEADKYIHAVTRHDSFDSYDYDDKLIYQTLLDSGYPEDRIYLCLKDHSIIPVTVKNELLFEARDMDSSIDMWKRINTIVISLVYLSLERINFQQIEFSQYLMNSITYTHRMVQSHAINRFMNYLLNIRSYL